MPRGNDRGKDFDDQWYGSKRAGEYKRSRGEGIWADDARLGRAGEPKPSHAKAESCLKKTLQLAALASGVGWAFSEIVSRTL